MKKSKKEQNTEIVDELQFNVEDEILEVIKAESLNKALKTEIKDVSHMSKQEIKTLVNLFYQMQDFRKAIREQMRAIENQDTSSSAQQVHIKLLDWVYKQIAVIEKGLMDSLKLITESNEVGRWLLQIKGIGPVLAAGLLANFDIEGTEYATRFISYCGLNDNNRPWLGREKSAKIINEIVGTSKTITDEMVAQIAAKTQWGFKYLRDCAYNENTNKWSKADLISACAKVPYNKSLKTHMWKVGCSFQWNCNKKDSLYGRLFSERRVIETAKNEAGEYAEQAKRILETKNIGKDTIAYKCYSEGKLPKAHINARCARWVEKIFVSHLFEEMYRVANDKIPPRYYSLVKLGEEHNREIQPEVPFTKVSSELE